MTNCKDCANSSNCMLLYSPLSMNSTERTTGTSCVRVMYSSNMVDCKDCSYCSNCSDCTGISNASNMHGVHNDVADEDSAKQGL